MICWNQDTLIMTNPVKSSKHDVAADAARLRALHVPGKPLLLANIWDPVSARTVESSGMPAIATASAAFAPVNGYEDHGHLPPDVAFGALRRITDAVSLPVTADLEDGYGLSPEELVERIAYAGACGLNLEDTDHKTRSLVEADQQAERIAAIKAAGRARGFDLVVNARIDVHVHQGPLEEGLKRARKYFNAGADCVYPIRLSDARAIPEYVALGPTNMLCAPGGTPLAELARAGVARVSVGPFLFQLLQKRLEVAIRAYRSFDDQALWT
jgi:2-methylisocitrate lyase-like PEP mutase family enzyme